MEHYFGKDGNYELCVMLDAYTEDLRLRAVNVTDVGSEVCVPVSKVYNLRGYAPTVFFIWKELAKKNNNKLPKTMVNFFNSSNGNLW